MGNTVSSRFWISPMFKVSPGDSCFIPSLRREFECIHVVLTLPVVVGKRERRLQLNAHRVEAFTFGLGKLAPVTQLNSESLRGHFYSD